MNYLFTIVGFLMVGSAKTDNSRTVGAIVAGAGLNDILREHKD